MFRRVLLFLVSPVAVVGAQAAPLRVTITSPAGARFWVAQSKDSAGQGLNGPQLYLSSGRLRVDVTPDSTTGGPSQTLAVTAVESRVHVEATEGDRVVASGDGAFVLIRRDTAGFSIEFRSRAPSGLIDLRNPARPPVQSAAMVPSTLVDTIAARLADLELERIAVQAAADAQAQSSAEIERRISALHEQLHAVFADSSSERLVIMRVLLALDARRSSLESELRQLRQVYTDRYPAVSRAAREQELLERRYREIRATL